MRPPLLLLLALLAVLAAFARAEEEGTLQSRFRGLVQKAREQISALQESAVVQQLRELAKTGISHAQEVIEKIKTRVSNLLEKNSASS